MILPATRTLSNVHLKYQLRYTASVLKRHFSFDEKNQSGLKRHDEKNSSPGSVSKRKFSSEGDEPQDYPLRINLWTAPRCCSTSLMYSFAQREDTQVFDEPLYAHHVSKTGVWRPYTEELQTNQNPDGKQVVQDLILGPTEPEKPVLFMKHMAKHIVDLDLDFMIHPEVRNVLLIRDPHSVVASYVQSMGSCELADTGFEEQAAIAKYLEDNNKQVIILDNKKLLERPEGTLRALCDKLEIKFDPAMLKWKKGGIKEDGLWAYWWYHSSHASTGFPGNPGILQPPKASLSPEWHHVVDKSRVFYKDLKAKAIKPQPVLPDPRNKDIWIHVGGKLKRREDAKVSVFDSSVQGGDACWEGLRIYDGRVFALDEHLKRMQDSAKALAFEDVPSSEQIKQAIFETLNANEMFDEAHIRLTLTRGEKVSSGMSPLMNQSGCCLIVLAEWKKPVYDNDAGIRLVTSTIRRNGPSTVDSKIHHNNLINNILAKIEANLSGVDDALMLDMNGFLSETNATNVFVVRHGETDPALITPHADACLPGITRRKVIKLARENNLGCVERNISLVEAQTADEMFTTGSMGEISPVVELDGREIGDGRVGPVTKMLADLYRKQTETEGVEIPRMCRNNLIESVQHKPMFDFRDH